MLIAKEIYQQYVANKELTPADIAKLCENNANVILAKKNDTERYYKFSDDSIICVLPHCIHSFNNEKSMDTHRLS